jgi:hypothetical protein
LALALLAFGPAVGARQSPQTPAPQGTARIAGHVIQASTGKPIPAATLQLLSWPGNGVPRRATVDAHGAFEIGGLPPGSYKLTATAGGYVTGDYGQARSTVSGSSLSVPGKPIDLKDGDHFDKADVMLWHTSAIEGQLLDEFGDPAPDVTVQIAQVLMAAGRTRMMPVPSRVAPTDDLGRFRAWGLPPGDYYVLALSGPFAIQLPPSMAATPAAAGFAPTYFPGTPLATAGPPPGRLGCRCTKRKAAISERSFRRFSRSARMGPSPIATCPPAAMSC